ncbi:MAG: MBL fold metallo-hydrolase [Chloroflexi bacterium]|nr:MAG: MBL fold metallo-hydrolase [Chloroflexota bacterium]
MGTAGARFMVARQVAASGGLFIEDGNTRISLDPGPGAVVQYAQRKIDLTTLDAIVVSHRHLDHVGDVNVMIEAMTDGGFSHRGRLFCPSDALDEDPVVLKYLRRFPQEIVRLAPETSYSVNGLTFTTSGRHVHQVETYGFRFGHRLGWITDSAYYEGIAEQHQADVMPARHPDALWDGGLASEPAGDRRRPYASDRDRGPGCARRDVARAVNTRL